MALGASGVLTNASTLTLNAGGTLDISNGTFTNAGKIEVSGNGASTITGSVTVGTAATGLEIGDDANLIVTGTANLTNSKLSIGLNTTDKTTSKLAADTITVGATETTNLTFGNWATGTYTIMSAATGGAGLAAYTLNNPGGGMTATLSETGGVLYLDVNTGRSNDKLAWGTATSGIWSTADAWKIGGSTAATFTAYDYAAFGAGTGTMDVDTGVDVSGMEVTAGTWTFTGGEITGSTGGDYSGKDGKLVVHSGGSATFENAIDFVAVNIGEATGNTSGKVVIGDTIGTDGSYGGAITFLGTHANNELVYDSSNDQTLSGVISGAGKLTKDGSGTLTFSADSSAFTGTFAHNDGDVTLNGAKLGGIYTQASGTTLTAIGTATLGAATFAGTIDLGTALGTNKIAATGAVNFSGATTIDVDSSTNGTYSLVTGSSITNATNASIDNVADLTGKREGRKDSSTEISYKIFSGATALTWTGATDGDWDATTVNWQDSGSYNTKFAGGDSVTFDSTATNKAIVVDGGGVSVGTMAIDDDYSFTGGKITASGAVTVAAGKSLGLVASATEALNAKSVDFNTTGKLDITGYTPDTTSTYPTNVQTVIKTTDGVNNFNSAVTVANQASADFLSASAAVVGNNVVVETRLTWDSTDPLRKAHGDFTIGTGNTFTLGAVLADNTSSNKQSGWDGKSFTKEGTGTLILTGTNTYTGATTISAGGIIISDDGVLGTGALTVASGASLTLGSSVASRVDSLVATNATLNFIAPTPTTATPLFNVNGTANISGSTVNFGIFGDTPWPATTPQFTLIESGGALTATGVQQGTGIVGFSTEYDYDLEATGNTLLAKLKGTRTRDEAILQSPAEGKAASAAFLNNGGNLLAGQGMNNARAAGSKSGGGLSGFGVVSGSSIRTNTGSHVDVEGVSLVTGLAKGFDLGRSEVLTGVFFETGSGSYDSSNQTLAGQNIHGSGDTSYIGGGVLGRIDARNGLYAEGSLRAGKVNNDYESADLNPNLGVARYDTSNTYIGTHIGIGKAWNLSERVILDTYGKYFFTHTDGATVKVLGDTVDLESVNSNRLHLGSKVSFVATETLRPYVALAWEREFDGNAHSVVAGKSVAAPSLEGDSGLAELGLDYLPSENSPWHFSANLTGHAGTQEGVSGNLKVLYRF